MAPATNKPYGGERWGKKGEWICQKAERDIFENENSKSPTNLMPVLQLGVVLIINFKALDGFQHLQREKNSGQVIRESKEVNTQLS